MHLNRNRWSALLTAAFLVALGGCAKNKAVESKELPELSKLAHGFITTRDTLVLSGPGPQFKAIAQVAPNAKVDAIGRDGNWLLVVSKKGNAPGYIDSGAVRPDDGSAEFAATVIEGPYRIVADTQVRRGPGVHYAALANVPKGLKINVIGAEEGWLKVQSKHGKPAGYVDSNYAQPATSN